MIEKPASPDVIAAFERFEGQEAEILSLRRRLDEALERANVANYRADCAEAEFVKARDIALEEAAEIAVSRKAHEYMESIGLKPRMFPSQIAICISSVIRSLQSKEGEQS